MIVEAERDALLWAARGAGHGNPATCPETRFEFGFCLLCHALEEIGAVSIDGSASGRNPENGGSTPSPPTSTNLPTQEESE